MIGRDATGRETLEALLSDALDLQYRFSVLEATVLVRGGATEEVVFSMNAIAARMDELIDSLVEVPAEGAFSHQKRRRFIWEKR